MKGFLGGVSIGALVAVAGAAMWSLSTPLPTGIEVESETSDPVVTPTEESAARPEAEERRDADLVEAVPTSPQASQDDDSSPVATLDMSSGTRPEVGNVEDGGQSDLSESGEIASLPQTSGAVVAAQPEGEAPNLPGQENSVVVSAEPAAPPPETLAQGEDPETGVEENNATAPGTEQVVEQGQGESPPQASVDAGQPAIVPDLSGPQIGAAPEATARPNLIAGSSAAETAPGEGDDQSEEVTTVSEAEAGSETDQTRQTPQQTAEEATETTPADQEEAEQPPVEIAALPTTDGSASTPSIGTPVVPLTERDGDSSLIETANSGDSVAPVDRPIDRPMPPFEANAVEYEAVDDRPLMSIVLIDDEEAFGAEALAEFPYPLTFAIDPEDPKAAEKMAAHRAAGFEVLILADLPREAAPQDAETTMAVWMQQLPQAVGVLEGIETGFQGNRALADQMVAVMQDVGYGMVAQNNGLNTVQKLALRDGLPSGVVFRDFDGAGQNPRAIRRFLDQAAFRARQEGAVIMLGRLRPDTISALLLWGLQDRASQVGLAPISAGLRSNLNPDG